MTSMLLGTFSNGTAAAANPAGYTIAGKQEPQKLISMPQKQMTNG